MAQPTIYSPAFNFSSYQSTHPSDPLPGGSVDNELYLIAQSVAEICNNLALIQRSDGALANNSVGAAQLEASLNIGLNQVGNWITGTSYVGNNFVYGPDNNVYQCLISHTSGTFSVDMANGKWVLILSFNTATTAATNAAASATASAASATASAGSAAASAVSAQSLQGTSATSNAIGTGAMTFATQASKLFTAGATLLITSDANPTVNNMQGTVTSYTGSTLIMSIGVANGSGTHTDWTLSVSGARGATGPQGSPGAGTGDMLAANNLSDVANASTSRVNLGLGTAAQQANSYFCVAGNNLSDVTAATALANLGGLSTSAAASTYAHLASPTFTGTPSLPTGTTGVTQATNDSSTKLATTAYVKAQPLPLMTAYGIGALALLKNTTISSYAANAAVTVTPGAPELIPVDGQGSGIDTGATNSQTWKILQTLQSVHYGLCQRTA